MVRKTKLVLFSFLLLGVYSSYGQKSAGSKALTKEYQNFLGVNVLNKVLKTKKDTTFTKYFNGFFEVDPTVNWRKKVEYSIKALSDESYELSSKVYTVNLSTQQQELTEEFSREVAVKKGKTLVERRNILLPSGLTHQTITDAKGKVDKACLDASGAAINNTGCFIASSDEQANKVADQRIQTLLFNQVSSVVEDNYANRPDFVLLNVEADHVSQSWILSYKFPDNFDLSSELHDKIVSGIETVFSVENIIPTYFPKDIQGGVHSKKIEIPMTFK